MELNKLIDELVNLKSKGYGNHEVVIFERMFGEKPYHTTVENVQPQLATYDKSKEVIALMR